ncbi:MAG: gliding motility protein GldL [Leadbetterella sp.]|nr:gliding motility protein GldL [Leadbetterella sp.]
MAANNGPSVFWDRFIPFVYSAGAAVVIVGAMGKIMHYDWASWMLPVGLSVEAVIFLIYAAQSLLRPVTEYQWEKVYPELAENYKGEVRSYAAQPQSAGLGLTAKMDDMLANANITPDIFDNLKASFKNLSASVSSLGEISSSGVATSEFNGKIREASAKIGDMNASLGNVVNSMVSLGDATRDAQEYRSQFHKISQNMSALNAVYEIELQDTNRHLKAMNSFYGNFSNVLSDMSDVSRDSQQFKTELNKLTTNLASLNNVYGSMLSAMKGTV